jgi:hypothetical protein
MRKNKPRIHPLKTDRIRIAIRADHAAGQRRLTRSLHQSLANCIAYAGH